MIVGGVVVVETALSWFGRTNNEHIWVPESPTLSEDVHKWHSAQRASTLAGNCIHKTERIAHFLGLRILEVAPLQYLGPKIERMVRDCL